MKKVSSQDGGDLRRRRGDRCRANAMTGGRATTGNAGGVQAQIDHGKTTYAQKCSHCHGPNMVNSGTITPDLRAFSRRSHALRHHGEAGQEQQDAAMGRHPQRRRDRRYLGLTFEPEEAMKALACSDRCGDSPCSGSGDGSTRGR